MHEAPPSARPPRESFFALKFLRLLQAAGGAAKFGQTGYVLLTNIVLREDEIRFRSAVNFWDAELVRICGLRTQRELARARDRVVAAGLLHYEPGRRNRTATYWVLTPDWLVSAGATQVVTISDDASQYDTGSSEQAEMPPGEDVVMNRCRNGEASVTKRCRNGDLSFPVPDPSPVPEENPLPPLGHSSGPDWLVIEADFLRRWNGLQGASDRQHGSAMPNNLVRRFRELWETPGWWERADKAMEKLAGGLQNGARISLRSFIERDTTIPEVCGETHDWTPGSEPRKVGLNAVAGRTASARPVAPAKPVEQI